MSAPLSFEAYRRQVLKELTKIRVYRNFHSTTRAFQEANVLDEFAKSVYPVMRALWRSKHTIEQAAKRLDSLAEATRMQALLVHELSKRRSS